MANQRNGTGRGFFSRLKLTDSYTSLFLGVIAVLIAGILFFAFVRTDKTKQTSSTKEGPIATVTTDDSKTSSTYTVKPGDDLWSISEKTYNNGYKWVDIAKANKLANPNIIHAGNKLILPSDQKISSNTIKTQVSTKSSDSVVENSSITGDTYKVVKGDNLWNIAVRAYGDGFRWKDISKANNLQNPRIIHSGNIFKIPR